MPGKDWLRVSPGTQSEITSICEDILAYLVRNQDLSPGEYFGSFWSEKGYHGPLLDYHAGGSHHHRAAASGGLGLWLVAEKQENNDLMCDVQQAFDWLVARQRLTGGYLEIQNNEVPSDWERTGLEECSTIVLGFVVHGLGNALLHGLPPKKCYKDCLERAGHWQLSMEWPEGSGIFPHHERSPYDTLNANLHAAESLALAYVVLEQIYGQSLNIFLQGAQRSVRHTLSLQWENGCFPYRSYGGKTINYTSLVLWCLLNIREVLPNPLWTKLAPPDIVHNTLIRATDFLRKCIDGQGALIWEGNETSTAKYNMWTYAITYNVLRRVGGAENEMAAERLLKQILQHRTESGLLPMRDRGEEITECAFMQADMLLFLLPFTDFL